MIRSPLFALLAACALAVSFSGGCKCSSSAEDSSSTATGEPRSKRSKCEAAIGQATALVTAVGVGVGKSLGATDEEMKCLRENPSTPENCSDDEERADMLKKREEGIQKCLEWPDDVVDCMLGSGMSSKCEEAFNKWQGLVDSEPQAKGPNAAWSVSLKRETKADGSPADDDDEPFDIAVSAETFVAQYPDQVVGYRDGKQAWTVASPGSDFIVARPDKTILLGDDQGVRSIQGADGSERWRHAFPEGSELSLLVGAPVPTGAVLIASSGEFVVLNEARCEAGGEDCLQPTPGLRFGRYDFDLTVTSTGHRVVATDSSLAIADSTGENVVRFKAKDLMGFPIWHNDRIITVIDNDLVALDPTKCGEDEEACRTTLFRSEKELDGWEPVALSDGAYLISGSRMLIRTGPEKPKWKAQVFPESEYRLVGGKVYVVGTDDDNYAQLRAVDAESGATLWATSFKELPKPGFLSGARLLMGPNAAYVYVKGHLARVPL